MFAIEKMKGLHLDVVLRPHDIGVFLAHLFVSPYEWRMACRFYPGQRSRNLRITSPNADFWRGRKTSQRAIHLLAARLEIGSTQSRMRVSLTPAKPALRIV
jgi:hypothetical protein